jgi:3-phenylpropionate/cinnamic acid dioxygenase small subunit
MNVDERSAPSPDDRFAIQELLSSYGMLHDSRDFAGLLECFSEDAVYTMHVRDGSTHGPREGRSAIVQQIQEFKSRQADQRRHLISNFRMTARIDGRVDVTSYVLVTAAGARFEVVSAGIYRDVVRRVSGRWIIEEKTLELDSEF